MIRQNLFSRHWKLLQSVLTPEFKSRLFLKIENTETMNVSKIKQCKYLMIAYLQYCTP
jgi:hypothetical protein